MAQPDQTMQCTGVDNRNGIRLLLLVQSLHMFIHVNLRSFHTGFCELNSHSPDAYRMRIESTSIVFTLLKFITKLCCWHATPTAAQEQFPLWIYRANILDVSKHTKVCKLFALPCHCMVAGSRRRGTWISTNYTRSLGKRSRFQQHLVSCVPAWQTIVVEYSMYGGLDAKASTKLLFVGA